MSEVKSLQFKANDKAPIQLQLFGYFEIRVHGQSVAELSGAAKRILSLLALGGRTPTRRERLAFALWPDAPQDRSLFYLRRHLSELRTALGQERHRIISHAGSSLSLDLAEAYCDAVRFESLIQNKTCDSMEEAISLYSGAFLQDFDVDWAIFERKRYSESYREALNWLCHHKDAEGDVSGAIKMCRLLINDEPLKEQAHCKLLELLAKSGDFIGVEMQYRKLREITHRELNLEPTAETRALYLKLTEAAIRNVSFANPLKNPALLPIRLELPHVRIPWPLGELIGREEEIHETADLIEAHKMVTLTGSGGVGKTRLALAAAVLKAKEFAEGIYFVDLAPVSSTGGVIQTVAQALKALETKHGVEESVISHLQGKHLLLLLDNCEHLLGECSRVASTLLESLPELHIFATSRKALGIAGEVVRRVSSLTMPDRLPTKSAATALMDFSSSRLFIKRAQEASAAFELTEANSHAILKICQRLDGIPLAIELAAARIKLLAPEQIAARLDGAFDLLAGGGANQIPRHQTLRAMTDWSYSLLGEQAARFFRTLSVFAGGWSLEAVEAMTDWMTENTQLSTTLAGDRFNALELLSAIQESSLVVVDSELENENRYRLLETLRQYGEEKLIQSGEIAEAVVWHASYYARLAAEKIEESKGIRQNEVFAWIEADYANLIRALHTSLKTGFASRLFSQQPLSQNDSKQGDLQDKADCAFSIATLLSPYWNLRGRFEEAATFLKILLNHRSFQEKNSRRAYLQNYLGLILMSKGDFKEALGLFENSLEIFDEASNEDGIARAMGNTGIARGKLGDRRTCIDLQSKSLKLHLKLGNRIEAARTLGNLGSNARMLGDYPLAQQHLEESLAMRRELGDKHGVALALANLGMLAGTMSNFSLAQSRLEESLSIQNELGDKKGQGDSLGELGKIAIERQDYAAAKHWSQMSLEIRREIGEKSGIALALGNLGLIALAEEDFASARAFQEESLVIRRQIKDNRGVAYALANLGDQSYQEGDIATARKLHEESVALFREVSDLTGLSYLLNHLAKDLIAQEALEESRVVLKECLILCRDIGNRQVLGEALYDAGFLAGLQDELAICAQLYGAAEAFLLLAEFKISIGEREKLECEIAKLKNKLGEERMIAFQSQGRALTIEDAVEIALGVL